jgi:hypothetical protein
MQPSRLAAALFVAIAVVNPTLGYAMQRESKHPPAPTDATVAQAPGPAALEGANAEETRQRLEQVLRQYPPTLWQLLKLDPTLVSNETFMQPYPALAAFVAQHPEVTHNPAYFFGEPGRGEYYPRDVNPRERALSMLDDMMKGVAVGTFLLLLAGGVIWIVKMIVEYRRWARLTKVHTEVHNKLLDRFTSNEDLLGYMQTPAGRKFLEAAPITMETPRSMSAPLGRILWSAQAGAVLTMLGLGIEAVSWSAMEEIAGALKGIGGIVIALGIGFLVSAVIAYVLSRRFGLVNAPAAATETRD